MKNNSLLERRYSFNATQIPPMAESTCLNWNDNNSQVCGTFRWGIPTMSSIHQKNKISNGTDALDEQKNKYNRSRLREYSKNNVTKIEPRIYADVQSRGLSSRIVKYHENGTRLNRNMSAYSLHGKLGQFPIVHLKRTPLPMRAIKPTLSMTHIPPPEKLTFQGNTLPGLLRSTSVLGLNKTDEDLSHENRPILHPPPTKDDLAPTRSVLDVLKEISRKRINSEDLDTEATSNFKRQRDINANAYMSTAASLVVTTNAGTSVSSVEVPSTQNGQSQSPEQPKKKRICNYSNNDITSSLSSSIKRKFNSDKKSELNQVKHLPTLSSSLSDGNQNVISQRSKMLKQHSPTSHEDMVHLQTSIAPITPITDTPQASLQLSSTSSDMTDMMRLSSQRKIFDSVPKSFSEPIIGDRVNNVKSYSNNVNNNDKTIRLTLFNKNYEEDGVTANGKNDNDSLNDSKESSVSNNVDVLFVKPKKYSPTPNKNNPLLEKNQRSKLALMLQSLKSDLYADEEEEAQDQLDSLANSNKKSNVVASSANITQSQSIVIGSSANHASSSSNVRIPSLATAAANTPSTTLTTSITETKSSKSSPLVGLKLDKTNSGLNVTANQIQPSSGFFFQPATVTTTDSSTLNRDVPKFSFGLATKLSQSTTTTTTIQTTITPLSSTTSTVIIAPLTSTTSSTSILNCTLNSSATTTTTAATTNNFTFDPAKPLKKSTDVTFGTSTNLITFDSFVAPTTTTTTATVTVTTKTATANQAAISITSPFSFTSVSNMNKSNQNTTANTVTAATTATSAISTNSFSFTPTTSTTMPGMTFSHLAQSSNLMPKTTTPTTTTSSRAATTNASSTFGGGGFSFNSPIHSTTPSSNNNNNNNKPAAAASPFSFGSALTKSNNASKTFSFGAAGTVASITPIATSAATSQNTTTINAFSFGNSNAMATTKATTSAMTVAAVASTTTTPIMQAPSTFNTFAGMVKKSSTSIFDSAVQPTFNTVNSLGSATAVAATQDQKTNVISNIFGPNLNNVANAPTTTTATVPAMSATTFAATNSIFGARTQVSGAASAQEAHKGFSFGSIINNNNNTTTFGNLSQQSVIGNGGAPVTTTASSNGSSTNIFANKSMGTAGAFNQNKPFTFGSNSFTTNTNNNTKNNNSNNNNNASGNLFKNAVKSLSANQSLGGGDGVSGSVASGGFAFGSTSLLKPLTATSSAPAAANSFSFTNNTNNNNTTAMCQNTGPVFTALGNASAITQMANGGINNISEGGGDGGNVASAVNKPFTFGSPMIAPTKATSIQAPNVFGASGVVTSKSTPTFSFGAVKNSGGVSATATGAAATAKPTTSNLFANYVTNGKTAAPDRLIRRATRRLQK